MSLERLREAHRLTETMLQLARDGEWESLGELEQQRRDQLDRLELGGAGDAAETAALGLLQDIQTMNRELLTLSEAERARVRQALLQLRKGDQARRAYR